MVILEAVVLSEVELYCVILKFPSDLININAAEKM